MPLVWIHAIILSALTYVKNEWNNLASQFIWNLTQILVPAKEFYIILVLPHLIKRYCCLLKIWKNFLKCHKNWLNSVILMNIKSLKDGLKANFMRLFYPSYKSKVGDQVMPYPCIKSYTIWIWNNLHHYIH